jgi:hypothetical protein
MAIETPAFRREDLYTLLVTTRIINFLKRFDLHGKTDIATLLAQPWSDHRTHIGCILLQRLAETKRLYFWTRTRLVPNTKFKAELFARVLQDAGHIACQNGISISVDRWQGVTA